MTAAWRQDSRASAAGPTRLCAVPKDLKVAACLRRLPVAWWLVSASCKQLSASASRAQRQVAAAQDVQGVARAVQESRLSRKVLGFQKVVDGLPGAVKIKQCRPQADQRNSFAVPVTRLTVQLQRPPMQVKSVLGPS